MAAVIAVMIATGMLGGGSGSEYDDMPPGDPENDKWLLIVLGILFIIAAIVGIICIVAALTGN